MYSYYVPLNLYSLPCYVNIICAPAVISVADPAFLFAAELPPSQVHSLVGSHDFPLIVFNMKWYNPHDVVWKICDVIPIIFYNSSSKNLQFLQDFAGFHQKSPSPSHPPLLPPRQPSGGVGSWSVGSAPRPSPRARSCDGTWNRTSGALSWTPWQRRCARGERNEGGLVAKLDL